MSHNRIKQINCLSLPSSLVYINLSHNYLEDIHLDIALNSCEELDLSYNKLKLLYFLKVS